MEIYDRSYDVCPHCGYTDEQTGISLLHLSPGTVLADRYLIGRTLGYGGFGVTYIAFDNMLQRKVAIKEYLPSEYATRNYQDPNVVVENNEKRAQQFKAGKDRFLEEGRRLAEVGNIDNVVHMYDCFEANSTAYIVMEFLEGMTLAEYLGSKGTVSQEEMLDIMLPLMGSLSQVHEIGIIHRDISPENIFLTKDKDGRTVAKLIDFGSAKYAVVARSSKSLTVLVNKGYSPEEQYRSKGSQGTYTDVYALSAVMYRMLTGVRPPDALERRACIETRKRDSLQPISRYNKNVSENVENAILNGMNVKVEDRSATVEDLVGELISYERVKRRGTTIGFLDPLSWPLWARVTVPLAALFAVVILVYSVNRIFTNPNFMVSLPDGMTRVPEFISSPFSDAVSKGEKAFLQVKSVSDEYTPGGKSDIVLTQDLAYGLVVRENSLVSVTVSTGKQEYSVPDVTGMTEEEARFALEAMGLEVLTEDGLQKGLADSCVISQSIEPYTVANAGETIILKINETNDIPNTDVSLNAAGKMYAEVLELADVNGVQCVVMEKRFDNEKEDTEVLKAEYNEAGILELTIALAYREFEMPNLNYKSQDIAIQLLKNIGITGLVEIDYNDSIAENLVYGQGTDAGETVRPNTEMTVKVSRGGKPFAMPSLIGLNKADAEKQLSDLKLAVNIEYGYSSEYEEGQVFQQGVDAGADIRRGDEITIVVCSTDSLIKTANVLGKEQTDAVATLESQKLQVQIVETFSSTVAKGKVISQLPEAGTQQEEGTKVVLTVSKGPAEMDGSTAKESSKTSKGAGAWSGWTVSLPSGVSEKTYDIEQTVQYRSRNRQTTTSTSSSLAGWTLYDQTNSWSDYGTWSDWTTDKKDESESTKVQSKTQYSSKTLSTTTSNSNTMSGWTLYDTQESWGPYGSWSSWSTTKPAASDSTKVESKTQYMYQDKQTTISTSSSTMSGWTLYDTQEVWGDYGTWSDWSITQPTVSESTKVESMIQYRYQDKEYTTSTNSTMSDWTREDIVDYEYGEWSDWSDTIYEASDTLDVEERRYLGYIYSHYKCYHCSYISNSAFSTCPNCGESVDKKYIYEEYIKYGYGQSYKDFPSGSTVTHNGETYYYENAATVERLQSRKRSIIPVYKYSKWGSWSSWQNTEVSSSTTRNIETRTVYRYATRNKVKTYYFYKWGSWSSWQDTAVSSSSDRNVQTQTVYRYCTRNKVYTYCFEKWSDWSAWSDIAETPSTDKEVKTRTVYRYASRTKQYTYYYEKLGAWSEYGFDPIQSDSNTDVQTRVVYRYRTKASN